MDYRKLALVIAAGAIVLYGCGPAEVMFETRDFRCPAGQSPPCMTTEPAGSTSHVVTEDMEATTFTYVLSLIQIPQPEPNSDPSMSDIAPGYNLDMLDSGIGSSDPSVDCQTFQPDFISAADPAHVGVDNQLSTLVSIIESLIPSTNCPGGVTAGCIDALLAEQISTGSVLLLVEVEGVNSFEYDDQVMVRLFLGALPTGTTVPLFGTDGLLAPDQMFMSTMEIGSAVPGDIFNGRLRAQTPLLMLTLGAGGLMLNLMVLNPEMRFDISATGLADGQIGGFMMVSDIIAAIPVDFQAAARPILEMNADITPSATPTVCEAMSVGLRTSGTTAIRL